MLDLADLPPASVDNFSETQVTQFVAVAVR
jgi:hypothetical protein